ncbi:MAG: hypothetical protein KF895_03085 [Parvibaculum sp.]|nr:hypothetical protein [Parvibaculum sp.]
MKSYLSRHQAEPVKDEEGLRSMRTAAWHRLGVLTVRIDEIEDEIERRFLETIGARLFGPRGRGATE